MANDWLDTQEYPFTSRFFSVNGQKMHYIDEGSGETLLFVHGTPTWSFDFRHLIKELRQNFRCIAIDHLGFGLSDKPLRYDYSTQNHSRTLEKFILAEDLQDFTLLVHDFGGPIGLTCAIQNPHRVKKLVIFNSWLWSSHDDPDYLKLRKVLQSPLLPFLYLYLNFSPQFILPSAFVKSKLTKVLLRQYTKPFARPSQRYGALSFAQSLLHDQDWFEELWANKKVLAEKPTFFIWGMKDPIIKAHLLSKFCSGFPEAEVLQLPRSGHFPQAEEPAVVLKALQKFFATPLPAMP